MPAKLSTGWTLETYVAHNEAMRVLDERMQQERDRRYREIDTEREKAVQIKQKADEQALQLSRDAQTYKDLKANELREQIARERNLYATKDDLRAVVDKLETMIKPLTEFSYGSRGERRGASGNLAVIVSIVGLIATLIVIGTFVFRGQTPPPQVIFTPAPSGTLLPTTPPQPTPR